MVKLKLFHINQNSNIHYGIIIFKVLHYVYVSYLIILIMVLLIKLLYTLYYIYFNTQFITL